MSLFTLVHIAWRNFRQRILGSTLTTISVALGVGLVVSVMAIYGIITEAFERNSSVGYSLVVGPPGSALQLTLNSVFYLSQPIENLPYEEYMEFMTQEQRAEQLKRWGGPPEIADRTGKYAIMIDGPPLFPDPDQAQDDNVGFAIPLALGDYYGKFRLVGTTPEFFNTLKHGPLVDQPFTFAEGENFKLHDSEIGFFGAVVGARVAAEKNIGVGDIIHPNHGDPEGKGHDRGFTIVGVLDPTGTPNDRAAFVNLEGFYLLNDHSKPLPPGVEDAPAQLDSLDATLASKEGREPLVPLTIRQREVTSILVRPKDMGSGVLLENRVQESLKAQAAAPIGEINKLLQFIRPLLTVLLVITIITAVVAANGILVSIYNSMNERRRDIAIMRALGARRDTVTAIILIESVIIAIIGGVAGWFLAHVGIWLAGGIIEQNTGVQVSLLTISRLELWAGVLVLGLAVLAGSVPAAMAYRTDVTKNLSA